MLILPSGQSSMPMQDAVDTALVIWKLWVEVPDTRRFVIWITPFPHWLEQLPLIVISLFTVENLSNK